MAQMDVRAIESTRRFAKVAHIIRSMAGVRWGMIHCEG